MEVSNNASDWSMGQRIMGVSNVISDSAEPMTGLCPSFLLATAGGDLAATGIRQRLTPGPIATLAERVRAHYRAGAGGIMVGAVPFDRQADDHLFQPEAVSYRLPQPVGGRAPRGQWQVAAEPGRAHYEATVRRALALIADSQADAVPLEKIVLSRSLLLTTDRPIDTTELYHRLGSDPGVVRFLTELPAAADGTARQLVGATPELLIRKEGAAIFSHPLAGSARRHPDPAEDQLAVERLAHSGKDQREHRWVVEAILDGLAPFCRELSAPEQPHIVSTRSMWHLGTPITGTLRHPEAVCVSDLVAVLHPTPAVGGTPRDRALALIPALEAYDRGFYAGAVGWLDPLGDGEWYVSLRCAEVAGQQARVYAGAGIVEGSVPAEEAEETSGKLQAVLRALGVDEDGHTHLRLATGVSA